MVTKFNMDFKAITENSPGYVSNEGDDKIYMI